MVVPIARALRFVTDEEPGIRRRGVKRFRYVDEASKEPVSDVATLERIRSIAVPPAWTDVWISSDPDGHIQAIGHDFRGRKQYRYHPDFRSERERTKFDELVPFGESLGGLRHTLYEDLDGSGLTYERVVALVVSLLECTHIRVGYENYVAANGTYGLTTLRSRHVTCGVRPCGSSSWERVVAVTRLPSPIRGWDGSCGHARTCPASCCSNGKTTPVRCDRSRRQR
jgi:DNA topoisomerase-1